MSNTIDESMIDFLKAVAHKNSFLDDEDFDAWCASGRSLEDAFFHGIEAGEAYLARNLLEKLGIEQ